MGQGDHLQARKRPTAGTPQLSSRSWTSQHPKPEGKEVLISEASGLRQKPVSTSATAWLWDSAQPPWTGLPPAVGPGPSS